MCVCVCVCVSVGVGGWLGIGVLSQLHEFS